MQGLGLLRIFVFAILAYIGSTEAQLQLGFYAQSCPRAEQIVQDFVNQHIHNAPSLAATLIRMHFHDCFVRGCDASVLINSTSTNQTEKSATPNLTVRGFDFIDRVKSLLEAECPGVVSCADIIALVARDSIVATGGPSWKVQQTEEEMEQSQMPQRPWRTSQLLQATLPISKDYLLTWDST
ncbi:hypothetical protein GH714_034082 [Hevea brasiliensis]|uniref:peroxidase n=1 Tax=Hevea brasiliensis TaxID=3981 RepID=A0A6A6K893_HEVBR|nr:hypothetical protein GH714_034082 [Hevea brasiliensis]